ncbi:hypothetical protein TWF225_001458 [Orbilia oligospora]|uniref:Uncharacterized protein n=1 Tax=Orbilia oligospora TaxID=2813651 RepID=A0A7C8K054_ORBOL|nr:hypothetical protein TWF751_000605 [Orbilia oligospora]KAF3191316.1 hypothetical protein TWF225_001458 [Orbilia oligospora]KAF3259216.1 hypothetical protein TWF217_005348 [Orbilia oligospora]KAF3269493.1 hypothetical protein TWF128_005714 [Orbilia oligospora]KAF3296600.1 hypothetical protein TWF132_010189 [Orbilia oligospora]
MPTLDSLPIDIKFIILSVLPTARCLKSLCYAFASYHSVYQSYHGLIESAVFYTECVERYTRDSVWLARYHTYLNRSHYLLTRSRSKQLAKLEYILFPHAVPVSPDDDTIYRISKLQEIVKQIPEDAIKYGSPLVFSQQKEGKKKIVKNHKTVLQISRRLAQSTLPKRVQIKPCWAKEQEYVDEADELLDNCLSISDAEERRIIQAIYRFFVGINVTDVFYDEWDYETGFRTGLNSWGSRGIAAVRVVRDFFLDKLGQIECSPSYLRDWELGIDLDGERPSKPVLPSRIILLHEFPDSIISWIDGYYFQDPKHFHDKLQEVQKSASESLGYLISFERWGAESLFFADTYVQHSEEEGDFRYHQQWSRGEPRNRNGLPHHRSFARSGYRVFDEDVYASRYERLRNGLRHPHGHTPLFDPETSVWDFDTLDELGYCFCNWRLSRSERYQLLYDEENPENMFEALGAGCIMVCEPYETDIHADEHILYTDHDDWDAFRRITRYKANSRWKSREMRRGEGLIAKHSARFRSHRQAKQRSLVEAELD